MVGFVQAVTDVGVITDLLVLAREVRAYLLLHHTQPNTGHNNLNYLNYDEHGRVEFWYGNLSHAWVVSNGNVNTEALNFCMGISVMHGLCLTAT